MLCERGIRTFETAYRFTLDLTAIPVLKELTHLPVIVDPSHAAGRRDLVAAAVAGGRRGRRRRDHRRGPPPPRRGDLRRPAGARRRRVRAVRRAGAGRGCGRGQGALAKSPGCESAAVQPDDHQPLVQASDSVRDQRIERLVPLRRSAAPARGAAADRRAPRWWSRGRADVHAILDGADDRLLVVVGPVQRPRRRGDASSTPGAGGQAPRLQRRPVRRDARVLREAAHDDRLEGADQRSRIWTARATSTRGCGWRGACCSRCSRSACRSAASSWTRSRRSTSPTRSAGARSAPARPRARSTASSARACRCRSASRTAPTATSRSRSTRSAPPPRATRSPGSTSTARRRSSTPAATPTAT